MRSYILTLLLILALVSAPAAYSQTGDPLRVGNFSRAAAGPGLPPGWEPLTFKNIPRHTEYALVEDGGRPVLKAVSRASASGLIRKITIDPKEYPVVAWRWKVSNIYRKGDVTQKSGDDYPARLYITFAYAPGELGFLEKLKFETARVLYGEYPPGGALNYIWESKAPVGTIVPNPYSDRARMVVLESGPGRLNQWVEEQRNILEDYQKAFGTPPPLISGVAVMTDSDNTGESATAYYGDIVFTKK